VVGVRGTAASRDGDTRILVTADSTSPQGENKSFAFSNMVRTINVNIDINQKNLRYGDDVQCKLTCNINRDVPSENGNKKFFQSILFSRKLKTFP
jgi:hypothetical protein